MKTFSIEEAKAGAPVVTRIGRSVRIICYDRLTGGRPNKLIGLVKGASKNFEMLVQYDEEGRQIGTARELDLFIKD